MSLCTFVVCAHDKTAARNKSTRVPEVFFYVLAAFGGAAGLLLGMYLFRHKTKKAKFQFFWRVCL